MRASAILVAILVTFPLAGSLVHAPEVDASSVTRMALPDVGLLPSDLPDSELLLLIAKHAGYTRVAHQPPVVVPEGLSVPEMILRLGERAGMSVSAEDAAVFADLDSRVAGPVLTLLVAIEQSWNLRDQAFAKLTLDEQRVLVQEPDSERAAALAPLVDQEALLNAAILLLDTAEGVVLPALQTASESGAWPNTAVADVAGVLRLGSGGNDFEPNDRIVQIDPAGDDVYTNNAGGTTLLTSTDPRKSQDPIAFHLDMGGNDQYGYPGREYAYGFGGLGVGINLDIAGDDWYRCRYGCLGATASGVGVVRDMTGDDTWLGESAALGSSGRGIALLRDDKGDDVYEALANSGGFGGGTEQAYGLLWNRDGADRYELFYNDYGNYGTALHGGHGWLVDEGASEDFYEVALIPEYGHGCNNCVWDITQRAGFPADGHANDNHGGLAYLMTYQDPPLA